MDDSRVAAGNELADLDAVLLRLSRSPLLRDCEVYELASSDPPPVDLADALKAALSSPIGTPPLHVLAQGRSSAAIITTDATRATPSAAMIGPVVEELLRGGIALEAIDVVIGLGAHRPATPQEIVRLMGAEWASRLRITNHNARARDLVRIGSTARGVPLLINRRVAQADLRIALGQVEPHEFAGFTGGRKAILPSVAGYESIIRNHSLEMLEADAARQGVLEGNPIHEEMVAAARLADLHFIVNVALDRELRPVAIAAGDVEAAHGELVRFLRRCLGVKPPDRAPAVIVTGPGQPLDINLYQTIKALVGVEPLLDARQTTDPSPALLLLSRCWDGGGSDEMFEPFLQARDRLAVKPAGSLTVSQEAMASLEQDYTIEKDEAYYIARVTPKCRRVVACCPGVADERLRALDWQTAADASSGLAETLRLTRELHAEGRGRRPDEGTAPLVLLCPRPQRVLFS